MSQEKENEDRELDDRSENKQCQGAKRGDPAGGGEREGGRERRRLEVRESGASENTRWSTL